MLAEATSDVWIFGYGSLIFRPEFWYLERRVARLAGFERRFWQSSPDHRGTPEAPGRVVTLLENPSASVLGIAYLVPAAHAAKVLAELDERERAGYERVDVCIDFVDAPFGRAPALVYQARADNPGFVGNASEAQIAQVVRVARGPSGDNASYVRRLARALRELGEEDPHVFAIERLLDEPH
ncbi:MAG: gamma-glutamylcyclotransferase [Polyangiaceae bacterium]